MIRGKEKKELEAQLKHALALIINKLASNGTLNLNIEDCLDVELVDAPRSASLGYDFIKKYKENLEAHDAYLKNRGLDEHTRKCLASSDAQEHMFVMVSDLLSSFIEGHDDSLFKFPIKRSTPAITTEVDDGRDFISLQADDLNGLVQGFVQMLDELDIDYKIKLPKGYDQGRGGRS